MFTAECGTAIFELSTGQNCGAQRATRATQACRPPALTAPSMGDILTSGPPGKACAAKARSRSRGRALPSWHMRACYPRAPSAVRVAQRSPLSVESNLRGGPVALCIPTCFCRRCRLESLTVAATKWRGGSPINSQRLRGWSHDVQRSGFDHSDDVNQQGELAPTGSPTTDTNPRLWRWPPRGSLPRRGTTRTIR